MYYPGTEIPIFRCRGNMIYCTREATRTEKAPLRDAILRLKESESYDTGHFAYCGENPLEMVKKHIGRIKHVHLKDIRPAVIEQVKSEKLSFLDGVRAGAFTIPGDGCIDFDPIFSVLAENNYEGYMVVEAEQDPAIANPFEYALRARNYIKEKTGL